LFLLIHIKIITLSLYCDFFFKETKKKEMELSISINNFGVLMFTKASLLSTKFSFFSFSC
jgi:hypothetical protein